MSIVKMRRDAEVVYVTAQPRDLTQEIIDSEEIEFVSVAGFTVTRVASGQHDGHPARVFTLTDDMGAREIGRLVVRDDAGREEALEWEEYYAEEANAERRIGEIENPVATATVDFAWDLFPSLPVALADTAAEYGVSLRVVNESGPGGGWPEVEVSGLRPKVRHFLKNAMGYDDSLIAEEMH